MFTVILMISVKHSKTKILHVTELSAAWKGAALVRVSEVRAEAAGAWRVLVGGAGAPAARALAAALTPPPASPDDAQRRSVRVTVC